MKLLSRGKVPPQCGVAPRAGAWIETSVVCSDKHLARSPPARGRGLKLGDMLAQRAN